MYTEEINTIKSELKEKYGITIDRDLIKQLGISNEDKHKLFLWIRLQCAYSKREAYKIGQDDLKYNIFEQKKEIDLTISEYLGNDKINSSTILIKENWEKLLNSDIKIMETLNEWKNFNIDIEIFTLLHYDSNIRTPLEKGYEHYFFDANKKMYVSYNITLTRNLSGHERKKYGNSCKGVSITINLPLSMWITVLRADIQRKNKENNKTLCSHCGNHY